MAPSLLDRRGTRCPHHPLCPWVMLLGWQWLQGASPGVMLSMEMDPPLSPTYPEPCPDLLGSGA